MLRNLVSQSKRSATAAATKLAAEAFPKTFDKVLIANRGEIACRVMKSCRALGIKTVAVYSEPDAAAVHVKTADEAYCIGPAAAGESYLRSDKILEVIKATGAQAVHPGYGFLSENAEFADMLEQNGITFIGPKSPAIRAMGDKIESKIVARAAGVNCIPGYDGVIDDADHAIKIAHEIGYPVMLKASAGGGGKGMRIAWNDQECREGFKLSKQEAKSSFGDDRILVEKYIDKPRHIEIQLIADEHGNALYLNERECSIQRRNQKVVEEAPSVILTPETRKAMGEQACQLAKAVGYRTAGTVEFLLDSQQNFYFLEMNTRLQVEHPVSELITGVDLVKEMLRTAAGHELTITQDDITIDGWAIECRVYAEDPYKSFGLPSIGRLHRYQEPTALPGVRCDSGIRQGSEISMYYDAMISKLITYGSNRDDAIAKMKAALDNYVIRGVTHNVPLCQEVLSCDQFVSGDITTNYLYEKYPEGFQGLQLEKGSREEARLAAVFAALSAARNLGHTMAGLPQKKHSLNVEIEGLEDNFLVDVDVSCDKFSISVNGETFELATGFSVDQVLQNLAFSDDSENLTIQTIHNKPAGDIKIQYKGTLFEANVLNQHVFNFQKTMPEKPKIDESLFVKTPMPGTVISVNVKVGDTVASGSEVAVLEAMKMQNSLTAACDGVVKAVYCKEGDKMNDGDVLVEFE